MTEDLRERFRHLEPLPRFDFQFENRMIIDLPCFDF